MIPSLLVPTVLSDSPSLVTARARLARLQAVTAGHQLQYRVGVTSQDTAQYTAQELGFLS